MSARDRRAEKQSLGSINSSLKEDKGPLVN
jgi:hypothetical protein